MNIVAYKEIEYSRVLFSELNRDMRVDAEYFDPFHLRLEELEKKRPRAKIKSFAAVTDGIHESIAFDDCSAINLISAKAPKENTFDLGGTGYISEKQHEKNPRTALRLDDVVISTVGTIGNCAVVDADILPANSDRHVGIIRIGDTNVLPRYISTYFVTKYGRSATKRETAGNVQPNLYIRNIADLTVPLPSAAFQKRIDTLVSGAYRQKQQAENLYANAENLLLQELGLLDWKPDTVRFTLGGREFEVENSISTVSCSEMLNFERLDAEHFLPKFSAILQRISGAGFQTHCLKQIILPIMNGFDCRNFVEEGTPYIRVGDIKRGRISLDTAQKIPLSAKQVGKNISLQDGDVLFTRKGSFGNAAPVTEETAHSIISSEIMLLRINPLFAQKILPEYLTLFFNSLAGYLQSEKWAHGVAFYSITQADMGRFVIPVLPMTKQKQLVKELSKAETARNKSRQLLNQAKRAVELFIEEGEEAALQLLEQ